MLDLVLAIIGLAVFIALFAVLVNTWPRRSDTVAVRRADSRRRREHRDDEAAEALGAFLVLAGAAWLGSKVVKAGFAFLKEVDWERAGEELKRAFEQASIDVQRQPNVSARLDRADQLLVSGGEINVDQAAMLTSATLELGLRSLAHRVRLPISDENDSLAGLAIELGRGGYIPSEDQRQIQHYAARIRNRVMHGRFDGMNVQEVRNFHALARRCLSAHRII